MDPIFVSKEKVASLLPMNECISVMEKMFLSLAKGQCLQPLRSLMWLPDRSGLLGMMPGYAGELGVMGIKVITVFPRNAEAGFASHQGVVILFDAKNGTPIAFLDGEEITAIRTAASSALATRTLSRPDSSLLAIIGSGEQAARHIEAILLVRKITKINLWGRNTERVAALAEELAQKYKVPVQPSSNAREAVKDADIICTVTASKEPVIMGDWVGKGTHINAVGACTPSARELDSSVMVKSKIFTDCYESLVHEAGDFILPKKEGAIQDTDIKGELGEVLLGTKKGRENEEEITLFKSLGIATEDLFSAWYIYHKLLN
jgi:alanine dehydrogenase